MSNISLEVKRTVDAPVEQVYEAWTDPTELKQWYSPEGLTVPELEVEPKVGGIHKVVMLAPDGVKHITIGKYQTNWFSPGIGRRGRMSR